MSQKPQSSIIQQIVEQIVEKHLQDGRWRQVWSLCTSLPVVYSISSFATTLAVAYCTAAIDFTLVLSICHALVGQYLPTAEKRTCCKIQWSQYQEISNFTQPLYVMTQNDGLVIANMCVWCDMWKEPCTPRLVLPMSHSCFLEELANFTLISLVYNDLCLFQINKLKHFATCLAELIATAGFTNLTKFFSLAAKSENLGASCLNCSPKTKYTIATTHCQATCPNKSTRIKMYFTITYCSLLKSGKTLDLLFPW